MSGKDLILNCFFQVYVIPRRNIVNSLTMDQNANEVVDTLIPLYNHLIAEAGGLQVLGDTALISFDRFFNVRTGLSLNIVGQLREFLLNNINSVPNLVAKLFENKTTCFKLKEYLNELDFIDDPMMPSPMELKAHYVFQPIFVLTSKKEVNSAQFILNQFSNPKINKEVFEKICMNPVAQNIRNLINHDRFFTGLVQSEVDMAKYSLKIKPELEKILLKD